MTMNPLAVPDGLPMPDSVDLILALGVALLPDGSIGRPTEAVARRTMELYRAGCAPAVLLSGGFRQNGISEAEAMRQWLAARGVVGWVRIDDSPDHTEGTHRQTVSAARFFASAFPSPPKAIVLVAHPRHLPRALWLFRRAFPEIAWYPVNAAEVYDRSSSQYRLRHRLVFCAWNLAAWVFHWCFHRRTPQRAPERENDSRRVRPV